MTGEDGARPKVPIDVVVVRDEAPRSSLTLLPEGMQAALAALGVPSVRRRRGGPLHQAGRVLGKLGLVRPLMLPLGRRGRALCVVCWASETNLFPDAYWREVVPWIFDCWGSDFARWEKLLRRHRVRKAFFSARDAAGHFARVIPGLETYWIAEACDPGLYRPGKPLAARTTHVLELGRKWEPLHARIKEPLARAGRRHLYSADGTRTPIFATLEDLYAGIADSALMVCYPKSVTHPEQAGGVETLTQRYFEAIGSGCLPVGHAPSELVDLFGFNPAIELSSEDPAGQLVELLGRLEEYQGLVDRSRARMLEVCTFEARARAILARL